ncbi:hypothetical protein BAXH7_00177 [Bacillus amyloliquefaciens XH7]|jgi:hypothetical protein|nr:hypothetical protein BAMTA208_00875 [Bacillus amyloliquefaciens TA208]AEB61727.1 hypothetical protein LL3_00172 [Bacillus amyloliquefaciens LL3]AEK87327.1 hypothetical protein BAXH7_00177 [Bacillus amyloliquefaciens XH7]KYC96903.1 hypothetical protein B425_0169 [Bacillus amyloliquefaciens]QBG54585.1 hypothetical protein D2M30_0215 [Bacillus amyloliquefaciens]
METLLFQYNFPAELCLKRVLKAPAPIMKTARARKALYDH